MNLNKIREEFLNFFENNNHKILPSDSLIPSNADKSVLFTNSGMMQFKNLFTGAEKTKYERIATSQKCLRAGGKHNDLENVGFTNRHHTFFEMLGNFSFGDYFKEEAILFAWEFLTKNLQINKDKLYFTVYQDDDEAFNLWKKITGCSDNKITKISTDDNFWSMGDSGPCGPCSEIFFDLGENINIEGGKLSGKVGENDRYIEIWNLVFMQFEKDINLSRENYRKLPKFCVDTGMGLERICAILNGKNDNYESPFFISLIDEIKQIYNISTKKQKEDKKTFYALRIIADHIRAISFLIADGILPGRAGRDYVLRRIMRRAMRYAHYLNENNCLFALIFESLINDKSNANMSDYFVELKKNENIIKSTISNEEENFKSLLKRGTLILEEETENGKKNITGEVAFKLYDTFGFPLDLTKDFARENNLQINEKGFEELMQKQQELAKKNWKGNYDKNDLEKLAKVEEELDKLGIEHSKPLYYEGETELKNPEIVGLIDDEFNLILSDSLTPPVVSYENYTLPQGEGYNNTLSNSTLDGGSYLENTVRSYKTYYKNINKILEEDFDNIHKYKIIFNKTIFYPEGGGQQSDEGIFYYKDRAYKIMNVKKIGNLIIHSLDKVDFLDYKDYNALTSLRQEAPKNHTATHLLQSALRQILGNHVMQKGSNVNEEGLRFDFAHNKALTNEELQKVENLVKEWISKKLEVKQEELSKEKANKKGALCFFEDKYGEKVRVIEILDKFEEDKSISIEFCGGTHVKNTKEIEDFMITKETSVASGIRRIEAIAGYKASANHWKGNFDCEKLEKEKIFRAFKELEIKLEKKDEEILKYKVVEFLAENLQEEFKKLENKILKPLLNLNENEIEIIFEEIRNVLEKGEKFNLLFIENSLEISGEVFRQFCLNFKGKNKNSLIAMIHKQDTREENLFVNILKSQDSNFDCKKIMEIFFKERKNLDNSICKSKFGGIESNLQGKIILVLS